MSSWYQPQEQIQQWYEVGLKTATIISGAGTVVDLIDMSSPNPLTGQFYKSSTYIYSTGSWTNSDNPPPSVQSTGVLTLDGNAIGSSTGASDSNLEMLQEKL